MTLRLLFISRWFPYPPDNGSKIRVYHLLDALKGKYEVHLVSFYQPGEGGLHAQEALSQLCASVTAVPYQGYRSGDLKALMGFFSPLPRSVAASHSADMQAALDSLFRRMSFDLVIASQIDMAPYALQVPAPVRILEELEFSSYVDAARQAPSRLGRWRKGLTLQKTAPYFAATARKFQGVTVVSERERREIARIAGQLDCLEVIPNGADLPDLNDEPVDPEPGSLIYPGAVTFYANLDAVQYFAEQIMPQVLKVDPRVKLTVTGSTGNVDLHLYPFDMPEIRDYIIFTGYLAEIRRQISRSWICVVPIRQGGGTRLKILEALACGTPVIATSKGAEGLDLVNGNDLIIADDPQEFASQVLRLLGDPLLRARLSHQGRQSVIQKYDWSRIGTRFIDFLERVQVEHQQA